MSKKVSEYSNIAISNLIDKKLIYKDIKDFYTIKNGELRNTQIKLDEAWMDSTDHDIDQLNCAIEEFRKYNNNVRLKNLKLFKIIKERLMSDLESCGIDLFLKNRKGSKELKSVYYRMFEEIKSNLRIDEYHNFECRFFYITINDKQTEITSNHSPSSFKEKLLSTKNKIKNESNRKLLNSKLYAKACSLAHKYDIDVLAYDDQNLLINKITDLEKTAYLNSIKIPKEDHFDYYLVGNIIEGFE